MRSPKHDDLKTDLRLLVASILEEKDPLHLIHESSARDAETAVGALDVSLHHLHRKRNSWHPLLTLPDKLLLSIFEHALQAGRLTESTTSNNFDAPLFDWSYYETYYTNLDSIRLVCRRWAGLIDGSQHLWCLVVAADVLSATVLRLSRSGSQTLCIVSHKTLVLHSSELGRILLPHRDRITVLRARGWSRHQSRILIPLLDGSLPLLRTLELQNVRHPLPMTLETPALRILLVDGDRPDGISYKLVHASTLRHLTLMNLSRTPEADVLRMITGQEKLTELHLHRVVPLNSAMRRVDLDGLPPLRRLSLRAVEENFCRVLTLKLLENEGCVFYLYEPYQHSNLNGLGLMLEHMRDLPAEARVTLTVKMPTSHILTITSDDRRFVAHSRWSMATRVTNTIVARVLGINLRLKTLVLEDVSDSYWFVPDWFIMQPFSESIETLVLKGRGTSSSAMARLFRLLGGISMPIFRRFGEKATLLPNLREIHIEDLSVGYDVLTRFLDALESQPPEENAGRSGLRDLEVIRFSDVELNLEEWVSHWDRALRIKGIRLEVMYNGILQKLS